MNKIIALTLCLFGLPSIAAAETLAANSDTQNHISKRSWHHYQIPLDRSNSKVSIRLEGMNADGDLYVRLNKKPSRWWGAWDCRPYSGRSKAEQCELDNSGNNTLHVSVYGAKATPYNLKITSETRPDETVYLLLHGLNSSPDTWNSVVDGIFNGHCPTLKGDDRDNDLPKSRCYTYHFSAQVSDGAVWENGDGSTYQKLGEEVGLALLSMDMTADPKSIMIVGHSRGGLAARSFLQTFNQRAPYPVGLLTIGTPHQGSPFGLMKHWLKSKGYQKNDIAIGALQFIMSPSTEFLSLVFDDNGKPTNDKISQAISGLNSTVANLGNVIDVYGHITSDGLELGENAAGYFDLLNGSQLAAILPGNLSDMRDYVRKNVFADGWITGDGIVPYNSQRMELIPGFTRNGAGLWHSKLHKISHADATQFDFWDSNPNDGETGQVATIKSILSKMTAEDGFTPLN
ncbi:MAG: hypothetical protein HN790_16145 [Methylococcales bacterium]|nr:hypothetical protein [Methylococcales bacterium]